MEDYLKFATTLAEDAGEIMKENFHVGMKKEWKEDDTPLTVTDTKINELVIERIREKYPKHSVLAEEGSSMRKGSGHTWVCDPVDGTIPFSHGYPTFVFSLALTKKGESVLGVIYDPVMNRMLTAVKGKGANLNGKRIGVSKSRSLKNALVGVGTKFKLVKVIDKLLEESYVPIINSAVYSNMLVALGEFAAMIYEYTFPWDCAAAKVVVEEAGGKVTDLFGNDQRYDKPIRGFIASNGAVHDKLVEIVKGVIEEGGVEI